MSFLASENRAAFVIACGLASKKTRPRSSVHIDRGLFISNVRLIATMRSRSKKGEVGRCCAQPCDRPKPIVIMVLPTDFNRSLICSKRLRVPENSRRVLYRLIPILAEVENQPRRQTIHHNSSSRKAYVTCFCGSIQEKEYSNRYAEYRFSKMANCMPLAAKDAARKHSQYYSCP